MQDSGHTPELNGPTVERVMRNGKRIYVSAFKAWLVEQALKPEVSVATRWPGQITPPLATPNSPRQDGRIMTTRV